MEAYSFARGSTDSSFDHTLNEQIASKDYTKARIERTRSPMNCVHRKPGSFFSQLCVAVPTGFEPAISALTGPHVWPLHHGTSVSKQAGRSLPCVLISVNTPNHDKAQDPWELNLTDHERKHNHLRAPN